MIEDGLTFKNVLILKNNHTTRDLYSKLSSMDIASLHFELGDWKNLSELKNFNIFGFKIQCQNMDWESIINQPNLKRLTIRVPPKKPTDFSALTELTGMTLVYNRSMSPVNFNLPKVSYLELSRFTDKDLTNLKKMKNLREIWLHSSNIESLDGIENFKQLEVLNLESLPKLTNIDAIKKLKKLCGLRLATCKRLHDVSAVEKLTSLRSLVFAGGGSTSSLDFLKPLLNLEEFRFGSGTKLLNFDPSPLLHLPELKYCRLTNNAKYRVKEKDIVQSIIDRHGKLYSDSVWCDMRTDSIVPNQPDIFHPRQIED